MSNDDLKLNELFGEPIASYTRAQALNDGTLVDVTAAAAVIGYKLPVAITASLSAWLAGGSEDVAPIILDNMLFQVLLGLRRHKSDSRCELRITMPWGTEPVIIDCGPGDDAKPVLTMGFALDF